MGVKKLKIGNKIYKNNFSKILGSSYNSNQPEASGSTPAPSSSSPATSASSPAPSNNSTASSTPGRPGKGGKTVIKKARPAPKDQGTNVFLGTTNSSNALGFVGNVTNSVSVPPYVVKRCDQVILVAGKRITNFKDYCQKTEGYLTMSVYMVNLFEARDSNKLVESITLDKMTQMPQVLAGAPGCIDFIGGDKRIATCFEEPETVNELIQAYQDFLRCRMGDNLKQLSWNDIRNIIMTSCMGQKTAFNAESFLAAGGNYTLGANSNLKFPSLTNMPTGSSSMPYGSSSKPYGSSRMPVNPYYSTLKVPGS
jgi:hypothetical protein